MDDVESGILGKPSTGSSDFFHELLQIHHGLGLQGEDPLIDILNTPISPPHGCIPQRENCQLVSAAQDIYQLSVGDPRCFLQDDLEEDDMRPLLDIVIPVSAPLPSPAITTYLLECPSQPTSLSPGSHRKTSVTAESMIQVSSSCSPCAVTLVGDGSNPNLPSFSYHSSLSPLPSPNCLPPEAFLATVLRDPIPSASLSTSSQPPTILSNTLAETPKQPLSLPGNVLDMVKHVFPGFLSTISNLSPPEIVQVLNALGEVQSLNMSSQTPEPLPALQVPVSVDQCEPNFSPYSVTALSSPVTPVLACAENNTASHLPVNCDVYTIASTPGVSTPCSTLTIDNESSCQPSPAHSTDCTNSDDCSYEDNLNPVVLSSFTHIDWTNKQRTSPSISTVSTDAHQQSPSPEKTIIKKQSRVSDPLLTKVTPMKRHAGGWPKGKPRRKDRQIEVAHKPKLPLSGYAIFLSETRRRLIEENPQNSVNEINKELGRIWSTMDDKEKASYYEKAATDKKRYLSEVRSYVGTKLESSNDDDAEMILKAVDMKFVEMVKNDQDNKLLWCDVCDKRFVSMANKFAHIESKSHLRALTYTLEKLVAVLSAKNFHKSGYVSPVEPSSTIISLSEESEDLPVILPHIHSSLESDNGNDIDTPLKSTHGDVGVQRTARHAVATVLSDNHEVTAVPVVFQSSDTPPNWDDLDCIDVESVFGGTVTSLSKLLNDFGKITSLLDDKCLEKKQACSKLSQRAVDLQIKSGEQEYLLSGLQLQLDALKREHNSLLKEFTSLREWCL